MSGLLWNLFINFGWKLMVLGSRRVNITWNFLRNYSRVVLELLEMDLESLFNHQVNLWNSYLNINSENEGKRYLIFKSHHQGMNSGQGPSLKCAPSRNSIKDCNIIKSYWHGRGVLWTQKHSDLDFGPSWKEDMFILVQPIWAMHQNKKPWIFLFWCIRNLWFLGEHRPGNLKVWLGLAPELTFQEILILVHHPGLLHQN